MKELYSKYIHFNSHTNKWYIFERSEQSFYLTDNSKIKSLKEFDSVEELVKYYQNKESNLKSKKV